MAKKMPVLYHYHPDTGEFVRTTTARPDPLEGKPLMPACSTTKKPPTVAPNKTPRFNGVDWSLVDDYRGESFYDPNGEICEIHNIAEAPDPSWTKEPPIALLRQERKQAIALEATVLIHDQLGKGDVSPFFLIAEAIALVDAQADGGERTIRQNELQAIFLYINQVRMNMETALAEVDAATDPSTVNLVHPT